MPIINGQKMACQPCIRGHRSTKCTHGNGDRMLVPVRKPGRPLSTCPHPPGKTCQCRNLTVALPKGGTCRCGGSQTNKTNGTPTLVKAEPSDNPPLSPTKQASFRVQKSAPRPPRKQSDASTLQRMDVNSLNFQNGAGDFLAASANTVTSPDWTSFAPPLPNGQQYPTWISDHSTVGSGTLTPGTSSSAYHTPTSSTGDAPTQESPLEGAGSCCSQRVQHPQQLPPQMQLQGQLQAPAQEPPNMMRYTPQVPMGNGSMNGSMMESLSNRVAADQQMYPINHFQQQPLFSDHSAFGTPHFPLQPAQYEQFVAQMAQILPHNQPNGGSMGSYTTHVCDCGPDCDCLGCLAHPYNQTTTQYIREAMAFQEANLNGMSGMNGHVNGNANGNGKVDTTHQMPDPPLAVIDTSPTPTQSPSDTDSPGANDLHMSPSEYLFVDYGSGICGCGDNCACVNCMIHRDPLNGEPQDKTPN
ncbi:hypothetical protein F5Y06DRAFT_106531 [Hypoxylon sp. FL0890]|nr:hypothetical protein F5Y06DRAFT_106531 [Hypoxylon sp. FL0890]